MDGFLPLLVLRGRTLAWGPLPSSCCAGTFRTLKNWKKLETRYSTEAIVISGISGRFPSCKNVADFRDNLLNQKDMVTKQDRWQTEILGPRFGSLTDLDRFDAEFFEISPKMAESMEIQQRKLLEVSFECILDGGLAPVELRGKRVGVFVAGGSRDSLEYLCLTRGDRHDGYSLLGTSEFMLPGRIAFALDIKGPQLTVNTGCSSSLTALEQAVASIRLGSCEAAIVAASQVILSPSETLGMEALGALSPDGKCKTFDESANGFVRAEAVVAILLQPQSHARRRYATILNVQSNGNGYMSDGIVSPSVSGQEALLRHTYESAGVDPASVLYVEAHGTGTEAGDPVEVQAIYNVFCRGLRRSSPLLLGTVKSNMGHSEYAAGLCSIAKAVIMAQTGQIPPNLHFREYNNRIKHLFREYMEVVSEPKPWNGGVMGISSFGLFGSNAHVILQTDPTLRTNCQSTQKINPSLLLMSGRSEAGLLDGIKQASSIGTDIPEFSRLLRHAFGGTIRGFNYRGYGMRESPESELVVHVNEVDEENKPELWYVFPGIGCQSEIGKDLMNLEPFCASVRKTEQVLRLVGVNPEDVLWLDSNRVHANIRLALLSITAVQIGFHDLLSSLGVRPSGYIGDSSGEILCAYADGCVTAEEAILVADAWGRALEDSNKMGLHGTVSVPLPWEETVDRCPSGVSPSGKIGRQRTYVTGPKELVQEMVTNLMQEGIFCQDVATYNVAFHSKYIEPAVPLLSKYTEEILRPSPRPRSLKWISPVVAKEDRREQSDFHVPSRYFAHCLANPSYLYEALQGVRPNSIIIEVAPQRCFHGILKEDLPTCKHEAITSSSAQHNVSNFLKTVGNLFSNGLNVNLAALYNCNSTYNGPAPASTPFISPLVTWKHDYSWGAPFIDYPKWSLQQTVVELTDSTWSYLQGHKVGKNILFPAAGYLTVAWKHVADIYGVPMESLPITFQNLTFERVTILQPSQKTDFKFTVNQEGKFCITENDGVVFRGQLHVGIGQEGPLFFHGREMEYLDSRLFLTREEFYREMRLRGYNHAGEFRGVLKLSIDGSESEILWSNNWTLFLDFLLQTLLLRSHLRKTSVPTEIRKLVIQPKVLQQYMAARGTNSVPVSSRQDLSTIACPGVEATDVVLRPLNSAVDVAGVFHGRHVFMPYFTSGGIDSDDIHGFYKLATIISENVNGPKIQFVQISTVLDAKVTKLLFKSLVESTPKMVELKLMTTSVTSDLSRYEEDGWHIVQHADEEQLQADTGAHAVAVLDSVSAAKKAATDIGFGSFLLIPQAFEIELESLEPVADIHVEGTSYRLLRKLQRVPVHEIIQIEVDATDFQWVPKLQDEMSEIESGSNQRIYLISQNDLFSGITGLVKCLRAEEGGESVRCIFDPAGSLGTIDFHTPSPPLLDIIRRDLAINIISHCSSVGLYSYAPIMEANENNSFRTEPAHLNISKPGDLSSLTWVTSPLSNTDFENTKDKILCKVSYAAISLQDLLIATGKLHLDAPTVLEDSLGYEFAGHDSGGNPVMGIVPSRGIATHVMADKRFLWTVPQDWSLEDACTPVMAYMSALYALFIRGRLLQGQSVLIHSGAGGLGEAAIDLALKNNCVVFTTVGNEEKSAYLRERFPQLKANYIASSRDNDFERMIKEHTSGRGVDLVLSSLVGESELASLRCVAPYGCLLQVSVADSMRKSGVWLNFYQNNIDILGIAPHEVFSRTEDWNALRATVDRALSEGAIRPLPRIIFGAHEVEDAFRLMMTSRHTGKIIIDMRSNAVSSSKHPTTSRLRPRKQVYCHPRRSYAVVGGLGGLGIETANWLVSRGARHLVLPSRSAVTTGYQALHVRKWKAQGVNVQTPQLNLSSSEVAFRFIKELEAQVPIGGIFNSALVLRDGLMENQTCENFEAVMEPKFLVTRNLDMASRTICKEIEYFVVFSSIVGARGYDSQCNYAYANAAAERICEDRMAAGHHGLAIQWGPLADVGSLWGMLSDTAMEKNDPEEFYGCGFQKPSSCMEFLEKALLQKHPVVSSFVVAEKSSKRSREADKLWSSLHSIFGNTNMKNLDPKTELVSLGMDSLVILEVRQLLERDFKYPVTVAQLKRFTIEDLTRIESLSCSSRKSNSVGLTEATPLQLDTASIFRFHSHPLVRLSGPPQLKFKTPLFIVHGNEGSSNMFQSLAARLLCPVYAFQFSSKYADRKSLQELSRAYIGEIRRAYPGGPCRIAGFSGGGTVAFEMATILENQAAGTVADLIFLDASCNYTLNRVNPTEATLNYLKITGLLRQASEKEEEALHVKLRHKSDPVAIVGEFLRDHFSNKPHYAKFIERARIYLEHISRTMTHAPSHEFTGRAHLIRVKESQFFSSSNYNLELHCKGSLTCHVVKGQHYDFLHCSHVEETANIINRILGSYDPLYTIS